MEAAWFRTKVLALLLPGPPPTPGLSFWQSLPSDPPSRHCPHPRGSPQWPWQEAFFPQRVPAPLLLPSVQDPISCPLPPAGDSGQGGCPGESVPEMSVPSRDTLPPVWASSPRWHHWSSGGLEALSLGWAAAVRAGLGHLGPLSGPLLSSAAGRPQKGNVSPSRAPYCRSLTWRVPGTADPWARLFNE